MKFTTLFFIFALTTIQNLSAQYAEPLTVADQMPYFNGCSDLPDGSTEKRDCSNKNLIDFIAQNLNYPAKAKVTGVEGTVYVSFIVSEDGRVSDATLLHDIGGDCGREALRVTGMLPNFEPAKQEENFVKVKLNLPIRFALQNRQEDKSSDYFLTWGALKGKQATRTELRDNLANEVLIRDRKGNTVLIDELVFSYEKGKRLMNEKSRGEINKNLEKIILKAKKGGVFTISASVQSGGEFIYVDRSFEVAE
ncbi:MAG: TonB family protein [Saprospiraceae bacterium]|jgi:TonB family protein